MTPDSRDSVEVNDEALLQRFVDEAWPTDSAHLRSSARIAIAGSAAFMALNGYIHGASALSLGLLGLQALAIAGMWRVQAAADAPRPPPDLLRRKTFADAATTASAIATAGLLPLDVSMIGWAMLCVFAIASFTMQLPLRVKLSIHAGGLAVFAALVGWRSMTLGAAFGSPLTVAIVLLGVVFIGMSLPFVPERETTHRLREGAARARVEREVQLRERRERELIERERELQEKNATLEQMSSLAAAARQAAEEASRAAQEASRWRSSELLTLCRASPAASAPAPSCASARRCRRPRAAATIAGPAPRTCSLP